MVADDGDREVVETYNVDQECMCTGGRRIGVAQGNEMGVFIEAIYDG